jgi:beta-N-acetylhexosaminidase
VTLGADEAAFFRDARPWGFILFRRNIDSPAQVRRLVADLREAADDAGAVVMIDQEGGRVQRLGPPHWPVRPSARAFGRASLDEDGRRTLARLGARLIANDLRDLGIDANCAPVADIPIQGTHDVIGDRAYAADSRTVAVLARASAEGLLAGGVLPVIKHIPGHGRAGVDSHLALPVVEASLSELEKTDFAPFRALSDMPAAMTAHVVYTAVDPKRPATRSRTVVSKVIRGSIGFQGLLISDDLSMKALDGDFGSRASEALAAGCDIVLHCNGNMAEMVSVADGARDLVGRAAMRGEAARARRVTEVEPLDVAIAEGRFARLMDQARAG